MKFNYSLDDMRCFCSVAQCGSFKKASTALDMPLSTLSRRVAKLEEDLAIRLLHRDAHRVQLTFSGQQYYERSAPLFEELGNAVECLFENKVQAKGSIKISAPINFGTTVLARHFNAFLKKYPDIHLDLRLLNHNIDIEEEAIDIAFRIGSHNMQHWVGRHLTDIRFIICGSVDLDIPDLDTPSDLAHIPTLVCQPMNTWKLQHKTSKDICSYKPSNIRLKVDELGLLTSAIKDGLGIGLIPNYHAQPLINSGKIQQLLPEWSNQPRSCQMLYRDRNNLPFRLRLFADFMMECFNKNTIYE